MKKIFTLIIGIVFSIMILNSQVAPPQAFSFKATIQGANGQTIVNKTISLRISILQDDIDGFSVYSEYFTPATNHYSQVDVEIGKGNVLSGIFSSIDWSANKYFLKVEVDARGGTIYQLLSVTQLLSVPYALYAGQAGSALIANETDPVFLTHPAYLYTPSLLNNGNTAFGWGNHASEGYLKSFTETDPIFINHAANGITNTLITNWNTAYGWGNHNGLYRPIDYVPTWIDVIGKPTFATVATSGSYNDLTDKPTTDGSETKITAGTNVTVTGEGTTTNPYSINSSGAGTTIPGNNAGDMQYWNGTSWVIVPVGSDGQVLTLTNGIPTWGSSVWGLLIGDFYEGGKVAYILHPGDPGYDANVRHGIIAAPGDLLDAQWGCYGTVLSGADGTAIGTGAQNTTDIATGCTTVDIAAKRCSDLELNGYSDWYLPSKDELNKLYINKAAVGGFKSSILSRGYWSSSESTSDYSYLQAWTQSFVDGSQNLSNKSYEGNVRAVRAF